MLHARQRTAGFLGDRESEARHSRLLLLRAGDIEENPGPNHCGWCKDLVKEANYLSCKNCETKFHMQNFAADSQETTQGQQRETTPCSVSCAPGGSGWNAPFVAASSTARRREINVAIAVTAITTSAPRSSDHNKAQKTGNAPPLQRRALQPTPATWSRQHVPPAQGSSRGVTTGTNAHPAATKDTSSAAVEGDKTGSAECATRANHSNYLAYGRTKTHSPQANVRNVQAESTKKRRGQRVDSAPNISNTSAQAAHEAAKSMHIRKTGTVMPARLPRSPPQYRTSKKRPSRRIRHRISWRYCSGTATASMVRPANWNTSCWRTKSTSRASRKPNWPHPTNPSPLLDSQRSVNREPEKECLEGEEWWHWSEKASTSKTPHARTPTDTAEWRGSRWKWQQPKTHWQSATSTTRQPHHLRSVHTRLLMR